MLAQERPQQRGLARPVAADDAEHAGPFQCSAEPLDQRAWGGADPHAHVPRADDLITAALRDFEAHRHRPFRTDDGAEPRQTLEPLPPAFGLFGILSSDVARDVVLLVCDRALLLVVRPLLREPALGALRHEGGVATGIRRRGLSLQVQHVIHGGGEKCAIVAHQQYRATARGEVFLEPACGFEIEVIGRLVEQQYVGGRHQLARETEAAELAAAQGGERSDAGLRGIEFETVQHRIDACRDGVSPLALEALQVLTVLGEGAGRGVVRQVGRLLHERLLQRQQLGQLPGGGLPHRRRGAVVAVLFQQRDAQAGRAGDAAARGLELARQQPQQRGLARAVPADDAPAFARCDREGDVGEQFRCAEVHADAGESDLRHVKTT